MNDAGAHGRRASTHLLRYERTRSVKLVMSDPWSDGLPSHDLRPSCLRDIRERLIRYHSRGARPRRETRP